MATLPPEVHDLIADPEEIHRRLCEATRTRRLLQQLLRVAIQTRYITNKPERKSAEATHAASR
jgi:hypothetical protein